MTFGQIKLPHAISEVMKHVDHMRTETPYRKSGSGQDTQAGRYVVEKLKSYGLEAYLQEFETYDSDLGESHLEIVTPERRVLKSLPCTHIEPTPAGGYTSELVDVGPGSFQITRARTSAARLCLPKFHMHPRRQKRPASRGSRALPASS